jgi:hypothetical protein
MTQSNKKVSCYVDLKVKITEDAYINNQYIKQGSIITIKANQFSKAWMTLVKEAEPAMEAPDLPKVSQPAPINYESIKKPELINLAVEKGVFSEETLTAMTRDKIVEHLTNLNK